jgi:hypothetical protein
VIKPIDCRAQLGSINHVAIRTPDGSSDRQQNKVAAAHADQASFCSCLGVASFKLAAEHRLLGTFGFLLATLVD